MKWLSPILVCVYLVATFQVTINRKYCHNDLIDFTIEQRGQDEQPEPFCSHDCCSTDQVIIAIEDDQQVSNSLKLHPPLDFILPFVVLESDLLEEVRDSDFSVEPRAGPLISSPDLYQLYCSYTFYS